MTGGSAKAAASPGRKALAILARALPALVLVALAVALSRSVAGDVSLGNLQAHEEALRAYVAEHPATFIAGYILLYAAATGSFVPLGMILMLTGGFLLGPWVGAAAAVVGATGGALITYLAARFATGGALQLRLQEGRVGKLAAGFGANAFAYILTLRLIPLSPFGLVNVAAGIARAPLRDYLAATVVGSVPICLIYAHLGAGLGAVFASGREANLSIMTEPRVFIPLLCLAGMSLAAAVIGRRKG